MATPKLLPTGSIAALSDPPASDLFPPCPISALGRHPCRPVPPGSSLPRMQDPGHRFQVPTSQSGSHHRMNSSEELWAQEMLGSFSWACLALGRQRGRLGPLKEEGPLRRGRGWAHQHPPQGPSWPLPASTLLHAQRESGLVLLGSVVLPLWTQNPNMQGALQSPLPRTQ